VGGGEIPLTKEGCRRGGLLLFIFLTGERRLENPFGKDHAPRRKFLKEGWGKSEKNVGGTGDR